MADIEIKDEKVWVTVSTTVKLRDFENIKLEMGYNKSYNSKKQDPEDLIKEMTTNLESILLSRIQVTKKKIRKRRHGA